LNFEDSDWEAGEGAAEDGWEVAMVELEVDTSTVALGLKH
jgi:hypothetical protein